jgi:hypothetical protein
MRSVSRSTARAYSAVEVMMAMGLLGLGAVGVVASMKTVMVGSVGVRDFDTATNLAQTWLERVRADATAWIATTTFGNALLLARGSDGNAFLPSMAYGSVSVQAGADLRGSDLVATDANTKFCSAVRLRCLAGGAPTALCVSVVATVAVFWPRGGSTAAPSPFCTADNALLAIPAGGLDRAAAFDGTYRTVTMTTVVGPTLP